MYLGFYKLKEMPFRLAPDPRFIFWSAGHAAALARIRATHEPHGGCAIVTGDRGAGKTGLLEYLRQHTAPPAARRLDLPPRTLAEFDAWLHDGDDPDVARGHRMILCDNAHLFHKAMLGALLRGESAPNTAAACIVLAGEPELTRTLETPELATLGERRCERIQLPPLTCAEVTAYIRHRLSVAGANGTRIFRDEVCVEIHRETKGNPRLVNALCDAAMIVACEREVPEVGSAEIRRGLEDVGRLVARQADERDMPVPCAPPDDRVAATRRSVFAQLRLMHGKRLVLEHELARGTLSIGRNTDNDLCIESRFVSRHHCRIVTSEQRCILEDVHSTNGLHVNDRRVRHHRMRDGDVVQIGEHRLHYVDLRDPAAGA